jgi:hypothetical protein
MLTRDDVKILNDDIPGGTAAREIEGGAAT